MKTIFLWISKLIITGIIQFLPVSFFMINNLIIANQFNFIFTLKSKIGIMLIITFIIIYIYSVWISVKFYDWFDEKYFNNKLTNIINSKKHVIGKK